jgi:hypothetical protein
VLLLAAAPDGRTSGSGAPALAPEPDAAALTRDDDALARILADAPPREIDLRAAEGRWYRYDLVRHWPVIVDGNGNGRFIPDYPLWGDLVLPGSRDGLIATHGGTDTSRAASVDDGFQLTGDDDKAIVLPSDDDSTEVVVSHFGSMPWTDAQEYWFFAEWSLAFVRTHWCIGLWGGNELLRDETTSKGSCFATNDARNLWDGQVNPSNDGVFFRGPGDSSDVLDEILLIARGAGLREPDTTRIDLVPDVLDDPRSEAPRLALALHLFGRDSVEYWANGVTGTLAIEGLRSTERLSWRFCSQDAGAPLGTAAAFWSAWTATRPRRSEEGAASPAEP